MRLYFKLLLFLSFFLTLYSCEYELPGVYEPKVVKVIEPPEIQIVQLDLAEDTLFLYESKSVSFKFKSNDVQKIVGVAFYLDDNLFFAVNNDNGFFNLNYGQLSEGIHKLKVQLFVQSGSGSIADKFGSEGFILNSNKEWILKVDRFADHTYNNQIQTSNSNGYLKLSWPNANTSLFKEFHIYKDYTLINKTTINEYIDSTYFGEDETYKIKVLTNSGIILDWAYGEIKSEAQVKIQTSIINGYLKFYWPSAKYINFKEYQIYRTNDLIKTTKQNEYIDSTYCGEGTYFVLSLISKDGKTLYLGSISIPRDLPSLAFESSATNKYSIRWGKSKFYGAIKTFTIYQKKGYLGSYEVVKETEDANDTSYTINNALFGDYVSMRLELIPKCYNSQNSTLEFDYSAYIGYPFNKNSVSDLNVINSNEFIYRTSSDSIFDYSVLQKQIVKKIGNRGCYFEDISVSPSGNYISANTRCNFDVALITSNNFSCKVQNLQNLTGQLYRPRIPISDIATGIVNSNNGFYIYDFNNNSTLAHHAGGSGLKISPNGDYLIISDESLRLLQFKNLNFKIVWNSPNYFNYKFLEFDSSNPNHIVFWDGLLFSVKLCNDFSSVYDFPLNDKSILNIDYSNNEMLTFTEGHLYVRSLLTGLLLKDIPINFAADYWPFSCYLINNTIVSVMGIMYFVN